MECSSDHKSYLFQFLVSFQLVWPSDKVSVDSCLWLCAFCWVFSLFSLSSERMQYTLHRACSSVCLMPAGPAPNSVKSFRNPVLNLLCCNLYNKAVIDSRLCLQWCFHLANVTEMEEMLDCKLDALIRSFAWVKKRFSCQHKSAHFTWPLTVTLTLSTPWMHADLESIVCKFGGDPAICLRELMVGANSHEFITLCTLWTNWLQYLAIAITCGRSN